MTFIISSQIFVLYLPDTFIYIISQAVVQHARSRDSRKGAAAACWVKVSFY